MEEEIGIDESDTSFETFIHRARETIAQIVDDATESTRYLVYQSLIGNHATSPATGQSSPEASGGQEETTCWCYDCFPKKDANVMVAWILKYVLVPYILLSNRICVVS